MGPRGVERCSFPPADWSDEQLEALQARALQAAQAAAEELRRRKALRAESSGPPAQQRCVPARAVAAPTALLRARAARNPVRPWRRCTQLNVTGRAVPSPPEKYFWALLVLLNGREEEGQSTFVTLPICVDEWVSSVLEQRQQYAQVLTPALASESGPLHGTPQPKPAAAFPAPRAPPAPAARRRGGRRTLSSGGAGGSGRLGRVM